jgi:leucyl-tRNA synthetase, eubacterial and mitochondrial family
MTNPNTDKPTIERYDPAAIEKKWQERWEADELYKAGDPDDRPKHYALDFFPYPSGDGLSVGHARNYVPTDVLSRYYRMKGYNVLHPIGFDAFGLPTENAAIKQKVNPMILNERYSANYVRQFKMLGLSYDWSRLFNSSNSSYYRWTQWIFLRLFGSWYDPREDAARPIETLEAELAAHGSERLFAYIDEHPEQGNAFAKDTPPITAAQWNAFTKREKNEYLMYFRLAFRSQATVNWDPVDKVVVANEEVIDGRAWRSGALVEKKVLKQWNFRITAYAERLAKDLDTVDWPARIVTMQRNWIGKSEGAEVDFIVANTGNDETAPRIRIFTTRPDTLWGATFMVLAPEHPLVPMLTTDEYRSDVEAYIKQASTLSEATRGDETKEKTGVFTGGFAINPVNGERIPVWIADYVMMGYGTGAIMAVPAHDQRDFEFAKKFGLRIRLVVQPAGQSADVELQEAWPGEGIMINSGPITGVPAGKGEGQSVQAAIAYLEKNGMGKRRVNYRIRDWLISRQRYWGTPIPIIHTEDGEVPVPEEELPVKLPEVENYEPTQTGESPLAAIESFVNTPLGRRETDTMATWACSSWYYMRFADPTNDEAIFDKEKVAYWLPVDTYVGGAEHAVLHLLYARMWTKVLYDLGYIPFIEPFKSLRNQGMILAPDGKEKMSKSKGNVITPDEVIAEHGADALRGYECFISDFTQSVPWNTNGVPGVWRWLDRIWRISLYPDQDVGTPTNFTARQLQRVVHQTIERVERDILDFSFNTVVSTLMEFTNNLFRARDGGLVGTPEWDEAIDVLLRLVAPIAPHMAEEIWARLGKPYSIHQQSWPVSNPELAAEDEVEVVLQVNGKLRDKILLPVDADQDTLREKALANEKVRNYTEGKTVRKVVVVPGKLVNIVVS